MNNKIRNNINYQSDEKIIYPAGYHIVQYDIQVKIKILKIKIKKQDKT